MVAEHTTLNDKRCPSVNPKTGTRCGLPKDHYGQHQNGTQIRPWSEEKEIKTNGS